MRTWARQMRGAQSCSAGCGSHELSSGRLDDRKEWDRVVTGSSIAEVLAHPPRHDIADYVSDWRERIDSAIRAATDMRGRFRQESLQPDRSLAKRIRRPSA